MQTIKWGPPGWRLLNSIASKYPNRPNSSDKKLYKCFYCHIGNVLPCIYCRQSYRQYIGEIPIKDWLNNRREMLYRLYLVHNKVNDKLRNQGYLQSEDPQFREIYEKYEREAVYDDCGWDFLYSIIFNYPLNPTEIDKYNYRLFLNQLSQILPYEPVRQKFAYYYQKQPVDVYLETRNQLICWFYSLHSQIVKDLIKSRHLTSDQKMPPYKQIRDKYESFRASCKSNGSNSCRNPVKKNEHHK